MPQHANPAPPDTNPHITLILQTLDNVLTFDDDDQTRSVAAAKLGTIPDIRAIPILLAVLQRDVDAAVRHSAARALCVLATDGIYDLEIIEPLASLMADEPEPTMVQGILDIYQALIDLIFGRTQVSQFALTQPPKE